MWIAIKAQKIQRDGGYIEVKPNDPVPEAEFWPNRKIWEDEGFIREVPNDWRPPGSAPPSPQVAPAAPTVAKVSPKPPAETKKAPEEEAPSIRDLYLEAPGLTEKNVDAVLDTFPTLAELAEADEGTLLNLGVTPGFVTRVIEWAKERAGDIS